MLIIVELGFGVVQQLRLVRAIEGSEHVPRLYGNAVFHQRREREITTLSFDLRHLHCVRPYCLNDACRAHAVDRSAAGAEQRRGSHGNKSG